MFWPDIIELKDFYSTPLGQVVCRQLRRYIRQFWPQVKGENLLGIGYATPYMRCFYDKDKNENNVIALMPAAMGVMHWPIHAPNRAILANEGALPFADNSFDRVIVVHALEFSDQAAEMMQDIWRVLTPGGRLLVIVPHRTGIWARIENTPFGHGHPFNNSQLYKLMRGTLFLPTRSQSALFFPPTLSRMVLRTTPIWEEIGSKFLRIIGGVLLVEAEKQLYAINKPYAAEAKRRKLYIPMPAPVPGM